MTGHLAYDAHIARIEDLQRRTGARRAARRAARATPRSKQGRARLAGSVTIRRATVADRVALERLAALDSAPPLAGNVLMAEVEDSAVAAIELAGGATIADPFRPTAELVELLGVRAAGLGGAPPRSRRLRLRERAAYRVA